MISKYQCTECSQKFDQTTAYCQDWRDPEKKLGCPKCHTFFIEKFTETTISKLAVALAVAAGASYALLVAVNPDMDIFLAIGAIPVAQSVYMIANRIISGPQNFMIIEPVKNTSTNSD